MRTSTALLCLALLSTSAAGATSYPRARAAVEEIDVRSLPSLLEMWTWKGTVDEWSLEDGVVFMVGGGLVAARDAASGEALWEYELAQNCSCSSLSVLPQRVVAGIDGRAIFIDRASGALVADVALGKSISKILADPLVVAYRGHLGDGGVVRLDETSAVELARVTFDGSGSVKRLGEHLIVSSHASSGKMSLIALDLDLNELWRRQLADRSFSEVDDGELVVRTWQGNRYLDHTVELDSGELQPRSPQETLDAVVEDISMTTLAGGLLLAIRHGQPPLLIRPGEGSAEARWQAELPVVVDSAVEWNDRFVLASRQRGTRSVVLILDAASGRILERLAGWRDTRELAVFENLLVSKTALGLAAARLDAFGPAEAVSLTIPETVAGILAEIDGEDPSVSPSSVRKELERLGPEALPLLVERIPTASWDLLRLIAGLVSESSYRAAADPLSVRVEQLLAGAGADLELWKRRPLMTELARALSSVGDARHGELLQRLLALGPELPWARLDILAALGRHAPERAAAALADSRARHAPRGAWLRAPSPEPWIEIARLEIFPDATGLLQAAAFESHHLPEEAERLFLRSRSAVAEADGSGWLVFPDAQFGAADLWAAPIENGAAAAAYYLGPLTGASDDWEREDGIPLLEARIVEGHLDVGYAGGARLAVSVDDLMRDSDGDGLTDRLEARLGLSPETADSDGDGLLDPVDRAPSGTESAADSPQSAAILALHEILELAAADGREVETPDQTAVDLSSLAWMETSHAYLADVPALEWRGGSGATFMAEGPISAECRTSSYRPTAASRALGKDELAIERVISCYSGFDAEEEGEIYIMRSTPAGWLLAGVGG